MKIIRTTAKTATTTTPIQKRVRLKEINLRILMIIKIKIRSSKPIKKKIRVVVLLSNN